MYYIWLLTVNAVKGWQDVLFVVFGSRERRNNNLQACASILISDNNYRIDDVTSICVFPGGDLWWANTKLIINSGAIYNLTVD